MKTEALLLKIILKIKWWHYPLFIFLFGIFYIFLTPPFQVPNEFAHFYRSFQISKGEVVGVKKDGDSGGYLPKIIQETSAKFANMPFHPENKISFQELSDIYQKTRH